MSILVFIEGESGKIKKSSFETLSYASELGKSLSADVTGLAIGNYDNAILEELGKYGVPTIKLSKTDTSSWGTNEYLNILHQASEGKDIIIMPSSSTTEPVSARLSARLKASIVTNAINLPDTSSGFKVKKGIYTGKAFAEVELKNNIKIITLKKNAFNPIESDGSATVEETNYSLESDGKVKIVETKKSEGKVLLPEADLVVSAGRGLKGPENWGMIEELADLLGAATACSKPVSDADWRGHHEHVGQTGIKISPNLYIAIGISGAIQHLAGVSSSKTIVVINTDEDAPFFKAADYGIVGDAFDVVPRLIEAFKEAS